MKLFICRTCESEDNLRDIFSSENISIAAKLASVADILVDPDDDLPKYICDSCNGYLDMSYQFKIQCETTDKRLRKELEIIGNIKVNSIAFEDDHDVPENSKIEEFFEKSENEDYIEDYLIEETTDMIENDVSLEILEEHDKETIKNSTMVNELYEISPTHSSVTDNPDAIIVEEDTNVLEISYESLENNPDEEKNKIESYERELNEMPLSISNLAYYFCDICEENFHSCSEYNEHIRFHSDKEVIFIINPKESYLLEDREDEGNVENNENLSKNWHTNEQYFNCETCGERFPTYASFNVHKKSHGDQRYQCPICMKWFSKKYRLKNHMICHSSVKQFTCNLCANQYTNQGNLDRHMRHFHRKEKPYSCQECGLSFSRSSVLQIHKTTHTNERNFACDLCNKRFKAEYYLKLHKKSHIPISERRIKPKKKPERISKQQNRITNSCKKSPIICDHCGKVSANKALHIAHIRIHTGEKPYECRACGKNFRFRQSLRSHELLHTGEKPYHCEKCGVSFRQVGHLKGHMRAHAGIKPYSCTYCGKCFTLKSNLVVHQRLHTGETPYHCNMCPKKFLDSNGFKRHKQTHHGNLNQNVGKYPENGIPQNSPQENDTLNEDFQAIEYIKDHSRIFHEQNEDNYAEIVEMNVQNEVSVGDYSVIELQEQK